MKIQELYNEAKKYEYGSLVLLIDYLVKERKVLKMTDDQSSLDYYLQERFANKMNEYLIAYREKVKSR